MYVRLSSAFYSIMIHESELEDLRSHDTNEANRATFFFFLKLGSQLILNLKMVPKLKMC